MSAHFLSVPAKGTVETRWAHTLKAFWKDQGQERVDHDARQLEKLRKDVQNAEPHIASVHRIVQYYTQLLSLTQKLPSDDTAPSISFSWYPAFSNGIRSPVLVSQTSVHYEKACVLFCIAAGLSQCGAAQQAQDADGVKMACVYFMRAAGAFNAIGKMEGFTKPDDLQAHVIGGLEKLMLAQAQECFFLKAVMENVSRAMASKLAMGASQLYEEAYNSLQASKLVDGSSFFSSKSALRVMSLIAKSGSLKAQACCMRARQHQESSEYGLGVAWLQSALHEMARIAKNFGSKIDASLLKHIKALESQVSKELQAAEKDNDRAYMDLVFPRDQLPALEARIAVQPHAFDPCESSFYPLPSLNLFSWVLSKHEQEALVSLEREARNFANDRVRYSNQTIREIRQALQNMGLPGSVEAVSQPEGLPSDVLERSRRFRADGGVNGLESTLKTLAAFRSKLITKISEVENMLETELRSDTENRAKFPGTWDLRPSVELQAKLRAQHQEYVTTLEQAHIGDQNMERCLSDGKLELEFLELTEEELGRNIPSLDPRNRPSSYSAERLKQALEHLDHVLEDMDQRVATLKRDIEWDDLRLQLSEEPRPLDLALFKQKSMDRYHQWASSINAAEAHACLVEIRKLNASFVGESHGTSRSQQLRTEAISRLNSASNLYTGLSHGLQEGFNFYTAFERSFEVHFRAVQDYYQSRRIQARLRMEEISNHVAGFDSAGGEDGISLPAPPLPPR